MPDEDKPPMPPQPTTKQLPAMTDRALLEDLAREMRGARADIGLVSNDLGIVKDRLVIVENWKGEQDARASKLSGGVRGLSQSEAGQNMQIASLSVKVDELSKTNETQLAILARLDKVASNPLVKTVMTILVTVLGTWAAAHGFIK